MSEAVAMTDSAKPKTGWFKAKWLIFAVIVTIAMFALMGWHVFNTFQVSRTVQEAYVRGEKLRDQIVEAHPYDVPEIVAIPVVGVHEPYGSWLSDSTSVDSAEEGA